MFKNSLLSKKYFVILLALVGITFIGFSIKKLKDSVISSIEDSEFNSFAKASFILKEKVESYIHGLQGMSGIYVVSDYKASPQSVRKYAQSRHFFTNFPGSLGYGFIRYVRKDELNQYVNRQRLVRPDFKLKQLSLKNENEYFIIETIEPRENNFKAIGLNIGSELRRREAGIHAIDLGIPTLTAPITLVQTDREEVGFLFLLPAYTGGVVPKTLKEKRQNFVGWSYTPIVSSALIDYLQKSIDAKLIIELQDSNGDLLYKDDKKPDKRFTDYKRWMIDSISVGGREWIIRGATVTNPNIALTFLVSLALFLSLSMLYLYSIFKLRKIILEKESAEVKNQDMDSWQKAILDGADYSIVSTTQDGIITTFNKSAERLLGYKAEELLNISSIGLFHDPSEILIRSISLSAELSRTINPGFEVFVAKANSPEPDVNEWTYIHKSGKRIPVKLCVTPLKNMDNEIIGFLGIAEDLTLVKELQHTILQQQLAIFSKSKMSALGEMASGIAHEINNPLSIIMGNTSVIKILLADEELDRTSMTQSLLKIDDTCVRISKIIIGLKNFSRESSDDPFIPTPVNKIIEDTLGLCRQRILNNNIKLTVDVSEAVILNCNSVQLSQVLMNLIGNSIDAIDSLDEKWIKIVCTMTESIIHISILDSGTGISPEVFERMLEPFFTTKEIGRGTGLGLSISKGIVEKHGGELQYSLHNGHTKFALTFQI